LVARREIEAQSATIARNEIVSCGSFGATVIEANAVNLLLSDNLVTKCNVSAGSVSLVHIGNWYSTAINAVVRGNVIGGNTSLNDGSYVTAALMLKFDQGGSTACDILIEGNQIFDNGRSAGGSARAIGICGPVTGRIAISGNAIRKGAKNMSTGIAIFSSVTTGNNIDIGSNHFDTDIATPYSFAVLPARCPSRTGRPSTSGLPAGYWCLDTSSGVNKPLWWDGAAWRDATGTIVP